MGWGVLRQRIALQKKKRHEVGMGDASCCGGEKNNDTAL